MFYRFILDRLSIRYLIQIILKASKDNSFCNLTNIVQFHSSASNFQLKTKLINIYFGWFFWCGSKLSLKICLYFKILKAVESFLVIFVLIIKENTLWSCLFSMNFLWFNFLESSSLQISLLSSKKLNHSFKKFRDLIFFLQALKVAANWPVLIKSEFKSRLNLNSKLNWKFDSIWIQN